MTNGLLDCLNPLFNKDIVILGVTGFQGAGKTTLAESLQSSIRDRGIYSKKISTDLYQHLSREEKRGIYQKAVTNRRDLLETTLEIYEHDVDRMRRNVRQMKDGVRVHEEGLYDNNTGDKILTLDVDMSNKPIWIIFEGVYVLAAGLRDFLDKVIIVDASREVRLQRSTERQKKRPGAHEINVKAFDASDESNRIWIDRYISRGDIRVENSDYSNPIITEVS